MRHLNLCYCSFRWLNELRNNFVGLGYANDNQNDSSEYLTGLINVMQGPFENSSEGVGVKVSEHCPFLMFGAYIETSGIILNRTVHIMVDRAVDNSEKH